MEGDSNRDMAHSIVLDQTAAIPCESPKGYPNFEQFQNLYGALLLFIILPKCLYSLGSLESQSGDEAVVYTRIGTALGASRRQRPSGN